MNIKELFNVVGCTSKQKVTYMASKLESKVRLWWHTQEDYVGKGLGCEEIITSTWFKEHFASSTIQACLHPWDCDQLREQPRLVFPGQEQSVTFISL